MLWHRLAPSDLPVFVATLHDPRCWSRYTPNPLQIQGPWLDDMVTRCLATGQSHFDLFNHLLSLGVSPVPTIQAKHYGLTAVEATTTLLTVILAVCDNEGVQKTTKLQIMHNVYKPFEELAAGLQDSKFNYKLHQRLKSIALAAPLNGRDEAMNLLLQYTGKIPDSWVCNLDSEYSHFLAPALKTAVQMISVSIVRALVEAGTAVTIGYKEASRTHAMDAFAPFVFQLPLATTHDFDIPLDHEEFKAMFHPMSLVLSRDQHHLTQAVLRNGQNYNPRGEGNNIIFWSILYRFDQILANISHHWFTIDTFLEPSGRTALHTTIIKYYASSQTRLLPGGRNAPSRLSAPELNIVRKLAERAPIFGHDRPREYYGLGAASIRGAVFAVFSVWIQTKDDCPGLSRTGLAFGSNTGSIVKHPSEPQPRSFVNGS
ncbi:hypothetical protein B0T22DRAFT_40409 [Podospora appendiculata]|uniref:Uncharacterized protein n=1 Tax=Podospora appendiculata TaxID=314037 RepID=A0AAE0XHC3_9PEZI|nr:hypothetical protein B0T22DRAFT_40409 [Podospora appendiculata]